MDVQYIQSPVGINFTQKKKIEDSICNVLTPEEMDKTIYLHLTETEKEQKQLDKISKNKQNK